MQELSEENEGRREQLEKLRDEMADLKRLNDDLSAAVILRPTWEQHQKLEEEVAKAQDAQRLAEQTLKSNLTGIELTNVKKELEQRT